MQKEGSLREDRGLPFACGKGCGYPVDGIGDRFWGKSWKARKSSENAGFGCESQDRIGEDRIGEDRIREEKIGKDSSAEGRRRRSKDRAKCAAAARLRLRRQSERSYFLDALWMQPVGTKARSGSPLWSLKKFFHIL